MWGPVNRNVLLDPSNSPRAFNSPRNIDEWKRVGMHVMDVIGADRSEHCFFLVNVGTGNRNVILDRSNFSRAPNSPAKY